MMSDFAVLIVVVLTAVASLILCGGYLLLARQLQILDQPNERSSHHRPTPHGGGMALMLALLIGAGVLHKLFEPWAAHYLLLFGLAAILVVLGAIDDLKGLPVGFRFLIYGLVAGGFAGWMLHSRGELLSPTGMLLFCGIALASLWHMNLFNFMDGIDGIAATQAICVSAGASLLVWLGNDSGQYLLLCLLVAASHMGFLYWNWQPARLFMGDAGSIATGFMLAALAVVAMAEDVLPLACWLILSATFITDATWTLLWRISTGQPFTTPHRLHAYQRLSRHWRSHRRVVAMLLGVNLLWLLPLALAATVWPYSNSLLVILAYLPLLVGMAKVVKLA